MFDNIGTAIVQAVGFFAVFGFFVYQLISDDKKTTNTQIKSPREKANELRNKKIKPKKKGLFGKKIEPIKEDLKPKKKGFFGRKN